MTAPSCHDLQRGAVVQTFARPIVEFVGDLAQTPVADRGEVAALRKVLPQEAVGVLISAALPG